MMADKPLNMATRYYTIFYDDIFPVWTLSGVVMGRRRGCGLCTMCDKLYTHVFIKSYRYVFTIKTVHVWCDPPSSFFLSLSSFRPPCSLPPPPPDPPVVIAGASPVNEGTVVWSQEKECLGEVGLLLHYTHPHLHTHLQ